MKDPAPSPTDLKWHIERSMGFLERNLHDDPHDVGRAIDGRFIARLESDPQDKQDPIYTRMQADELTEVLNQVEALGRAGTTGGFLPRAPRMTGAPVQIRDSLF